ncbi:MAG: transposase [Moorea sp. SIO2B7]|nr:transposase [Moorena sp. SIO2B7]
MSLFTEIRTISSKKTRSSSQAATERVHSERVDYWISLKEVDALNLVFLEETGILLGDNRAYARSALGTRVGELKPFYRGAKITLVGAITQDQVLALMTLDGSLDGAAFQVFIDHFLLPKLWHGAVVVMDKLAVHKMASVVTKIEAVGGSLVYLSAYSPDFGPIELWWSQLKLNLRSFAPTTSAMIDIILAAALDLINPQHLRNWESSLLLLYINTALRAVID